MSKTALDLSRALERLDAHYSGLGTIPDGGAPVGHYDRLDRITRGMKRLSDRLRAIPADAEKRIAKLEARDKMTESIRRDWYRDVVKGDAMTEGERRVRAMSTELLEENQPAVGQARSQWQAMSKGLLKKKPDCPLCTVTSRDGTVPCVHDTCVLDNFTHTTTRKCGEEYKAWALAYQEADGNLHAPAVMTAAGKMAELLDWLHGVITDELGTRAAQKTQQQMWEDSEAMREEAKDLATAWHGFKLEERVRLKWESEGVVVGGDVEFVVVKPDDQTDLAYIHPGDLEHVPPLAEPESWHGFEEGERIRYHGEPRGIGIVTGGDHRNVRFKHNKDGEDRRDRWAHPANLAHLPAEPDRRCGTCAYWPKNGLPPGLRGRWGCYVDYTGSIHHDSGSKCKHWNARDCITCGGLWDCDSGRKLSDGCWKPKPRTPDPDPDRCNTCARDDDCDAVSAEGCSYKLKPVHLCSECVDHGKCDGDSTPEDGCWRVEPEPWPGWDAQTVITVPILPPDVKDMRASLSNERLTVEMTDTIRWSRQTFGAMPYEDGTRLERIINELAQRARLSGKAGG